MHPLLKRQLKHAGVNPEGLPEALSRLLEAVGAAYEQIDADRRLSERSLELTSQELLERNRQLVARNKELDALRQAGLDCIITMDHEGNIREFNPAAEKTFGYSRDQVIGRNLAQLVVPTALREMHRDGLAKFLSSGEGPVIGRRIETCAVRRDGQEFPVELAISVVQTDNTPIFVAYLRDITERKHAERESRRAEKLAIVASRTDNAVIITDVNGRIEWVNDGFTRISGYSSDEVIGKKPGKLLQGPQTDPATVQLIRERLARGEGFRTEILNYAKNGRQYWLAIEVQPIYGADGQLMNFMAIESDISQRKRVERELHQAKEQAEAASQAKSEFLANMSHEIRTPLNGITGMTELLLATDLDPNQRRFVQIAKSSADKLLVVINQILDFSKIEAGKLELENIDFELRGIIEEVTEMLAHRANSKGLALAYWIDPQVPLSLRGDPARVRQVLINLVTNAVKFTQRGEVIIRVLVESRIGEQVTLRFAVADTGVGIAPERRDRLFKPFSQVDASTTRKYGGTGLGLVICKQLAEMMGGQIGVDSVENRGSVFWFTSRFTLSPGRSAAAPNTVALNSAASHIDLSGLHVLAFDENAAVRQILCDQLAAWGTKVESAGDLEEAFARLRDAAARRQRFSIALIDVGTAGAQAKLVAAIDADPALRETGIVLMTSLSTPIQPGAGKPNGLWNLVAKPIRQSQLFDAVMRAAAASLGHAPVVEPAAPSRVDHPTAARQARILLAEDNEVNQLVASEILSRAGFQCDIVTNGQQAADAVRQRRYDAVLMDCQMPEVDGFQATAAIRAFESEPGWPARRVPIVALTASALKGDRDHCLAAGMDDYLSKPLDSRQLILTLNRVLGDPGEATTEVIQAPASSAPLDMNALLARCMGDAGFLQRLLNKAPEQVEKLVSRIAGALEAGDRTGLARAAHGLKGAAANLSAPAVQKLAAELETLGTTGTLDEAQALIEGLKAEVDRCIRFVRQAQPAPDAPGARKS